MTPFDRFFSRVVVGPADCWLWTGGLTEHGYGRFYVGGKYQKAHRFCYATLVGPIPTERPHLDHLCRVRNCVNPDHLRPVTPIENRLAPGSQAHAAKTHCKRGHEFTPENTYVRHNGHRRCRTCHNDARRVGGRIEEAS